MKQDKTCPVYKSHGEGAATFPVLNALWHLYLSDWILHNLEISVMSDGDLAKSGTLWHFASLYESGILGNIILDVFRVDHFLSNSDEA